MDTSCILHDFGNGLIVRHAHTDDTAALAEMEIQAFANPDTGEPDIYIGGWTRDLMSGNHPNFCPEDYLIVVDTTCDKIVSCLCLISQTWNMQGISFGVGRIGIVATDAAYRRRGLVRQLFRHVHEISAVRGELAQAITGIPYYYRQFGYEYAIEMSSFHESFVPQQIPVLKEDKPEKFRMRHPQLQDLPFILELCASESARSLVSAERNLQLIEYEEFLEADPKSGSVAWTDIIETPEGERVGILKHRRYIYQGRHTTVLFEILPQFSWGDVGPFAMRELVRQAEHIENEDNQPLAKLAWTMPSNHPFIELMSEYTSALANGYAWYIRVPDLPAFLTRIAPVLENRIASSGQRNYSGLLRLNFFTGGVEMNWQAGKLTSAQPWTATAGDYGQTGFGNASFPDRTFLKLLFGFRSLQELQEMFPDCITDNQETAVLLNALFPKQLSHVLPIH